MEMVRKIISTRGRLHRTRDIPAVMALVWSYSRVLDLHYLWRALESLSITTGLLLHAQEEEDRRDDASDNGNDNEENEQEAFVVVEQLLSPPHRQPSRRPSFIR
ncbi:hypothetical protein EMPS_07792 [Entomortierella parvispora]|uniref:Uncharacterized protein n=1 Tax=Entomortierella parvispora TaxID=205924 RepID=A0A9P3HEZ0_9FUNG|nr:hypothetical protein EMPS_07792 [Entomortierella parvispora]